MHSEAWKRCWRAPGQLPAFPLENISAAFDSGKTVRQIVEV
jgi:hypothetical protein